MWEPLEQCNVCARRVDKDNPDDFVQFIDTLTEEPASVVHRKCLLRELGREQ